MKNQLKPFLLGLVLLLTLITSSQSRPAVKPKRTIIERIEFHDIPMAEALRMLSDQYKLNVITSKKAAEVKVTMFLNKVSPEEVLKALTKTYNLWYKKDPDSNIYRMYTSEEFRLGNVDSNRENIRVFTARYQNVLSIAYAIKNLYPERVQMALGEEQEEIYSDLMNRFMRFDLIAGRSTNKSESDRNNNSRTTNISSRTTNNNRNINSNNFASNNNNKGNALSLINNKNLQTSVQNIISGDLSTSTKMIKQYVHEDAPIFLTLLKNQNNILVRTRDPVALNEVQKLVEDLDKRPITLLLEVKILSIDLSDDFNSVFDISLADQTIRPADTGENVIIPENIMSTSGLATIATSTFTPALLAKVVSDQFEVKLKLLESEGRVTELASPTVYTANQEVSRINLVSEVPIVKSYRVVTTSGGTQIGNAVARLEPQTEIEELGTTLIMTPSVSTDKSVNLNILIDRSSVGIKKSIIPIENGKGDIVDQPVDTVDRRSFAGNVIIQNQTSVVIGGLITERASDVERKVPILGDIPYLGLLFTDTGRERKRTELVIVVKPYVMDTDIEEKLISQEYLKDQSIHPALKGKDSSLNIYTNPELEHKKYNLEHDFELHR